MKLRIKEICKERQVSMATLAERLGITPVSLSQCLSGNPSLNRLQEIAKILDVDVVDLFESTGNVDIKGCVFIGNKPYIVQSKNDLQELLNNI